MAAIIRRQDHAPAITAPALHHPLRQSAPHRRHASSRRRLRHEARCRDNARRVKRCLEGLVAPVRVLLGRCRRCGPTRLGGQRDHSGRPGEGRWRRRREHPRAPHIHLRGREGGGGESAGTTAGEGGGGGDRGARAGVGGGKLWGVCEESI